jgi:hypothetical protein
MTRPLSSFELMPPPPRARRAGLGRGPTRAVPRIVTRAIGALTLSVATALGALAATAPTAPRATLDDARRSPLIHEIARADAELFSALFDTCDPRELRARVAADIEYVHARWGVIGRDAAEMLGVAEKHCARVDRGREPRLRRETVPGSLEVFALAGDGALALGRQRTFAQAPDGQWRALGESRFSQLWRRDGGQWRAARVIEFDWREAARP